MLFRSFYPHYIGPFELSCGEAETLNYTLVLPPEFQIHPKVHARSLKLAHKNDPELFPDQVPLKPPPIDFEDNQYIVEAILDHRKHGRTRQFLVHWEGYADTDDCWVLKRDIDRELVQAYLEKLDEETSDNKSRKLDTQTTMPSPKGMGGRSART